MGQSKIDVFTELLGDANKAEQANIAFEESYVREIAKVGAVSIPGAQEIFAYLRSQRIAVALTTGFSRSTLDTLITELGWRDLIDVSVTPGEAGRGRPHPDMLHRAATTAGITNPAHVIVLGDTASDMKSGVAYGAGQVVGVLSGAHDEVTLREHAFPQASEEFIRECMADADRRLTPNVEVTGLCGFLRRSG
jgi:phosphonatase-like hydrolase